MNATRKTGYVCAKSSGEDEIRRALGTRFAKAQVQTFVFRAIEMILKPDEEIRLPKRDQVRRLEKLRAAVAIARAELTPKARLPILLGAAASAWGQRVKDGKHGFVVIVDPHARFGRIDADLGALDAVAKIALDDVERNRTFAKTGAGRPTQPRIHRAAHVALLWKDVFSKYPGASRGGPFAEVLRIILRNDDEESAPGDFLRITRAAIELAQLIDLDRCKNSRK